MLALIERGIGRKALYRCECGVNVRAFVNNVNRGHTKSCGCLRREVTSQRSKTHGHSVELTQAYLCWKNLRNRCDNPQNNSYADYGGRGIYYSPKWIRFENFLADMGEPKEDDLSLDRIDVQGHYYAENCRWADRKTQMRNKRTNRVIEHNGESLSLVEWSERSGIRYYTLMARLDRGIPMAMALSTAKYLKVNRCPRP